MKQTEQSLVRRLRKYGTGSPDALLLMHEAADALERQLAAPLSAELTDEQIEDMIEAALNQVKSAALSKALTREKWKDGIDIDVPTFDATRFARALLAQRAAPHAQNLSVKLAKMSESNGNVWWSVYLAKSDDAQLWDCHEVYNDPIKGRAEYEADKLKHFLGLGPQPDILAYDTDAPHAQGSGKDAPIIQALRDGIPLTEPVWIGKALLAQREARTVLDGGTGPLACVHLVNIGLTGWVHTKETADAFTKGYNMALKQYRSALLGVAAAPQEAPQPYTDIISDGGMDPRK